MTTLATAFVTIRPDTARFGAQLSKNVGTSAGKAGADAGKTMTSSFKSALKVSGVLAGAFAVTKGVTFFKGAIDEANEARKVSAQTAAVLKSTGGVAGISAKGIGDLATAISNKVGVDDEAIQSGANLLLTFKNIRNEQGKGNDIFNQSTQVMTDMAVAMGTDVKGGAIQLGKALNDPVKGISALSRVGVTFDESQKKTIKRMVESGNVMGAQRIILKELNSEFAVSAEAQATPAEKAAVAWGNLKETIGGAVLPVIDRLATLATERVIPAMSRFVAEVQNGTGAGGRFRDMVERTGRVLLNVGNFLLDHKEAVAAIAAVYVTVRAAMWAHTVVTKAAAAATTVWAAAQWLLNAALTANPIGIVVVALAALAAAAVVAYKKSETFRRIVDGAWSGIKTAASTSWDFIKRVFGWLKDGFGNIGDAAGAMKRTVAGAWDAIKDNTRLAVLYVADKVLWVAEKILGAMTAAFGWAPGIGDKLKGALVAVKGFREGLNKEMDKLRDEEVLVSLKAVTYHMAGRPSATGRSATDRAAGGGGPLPRYLHEAMGGGMVPRMSAPLSPVRRGARAIQRDVHGLAVDQAQAMQDQLRTAAASAVTAGVSGVGPSGTAGRVLPGGAYRVGMPYHGYPGHNGADYPAATGTPVWSPWSGRVIASYDLPGSNPYNGTPYRSYGRLVKIAHSNGLSTLYAHLSQRGVASGTRVRAGQFIGRVGMNGNATGPHLHFEVGRNGSTFNPASLGIFDRGGLARGRGGMFKNTIKPERVLDPRTTRNFERMTYTLDKMAAGGRAAAPATPQRVVIDFGGGRTLTGWIDERVDGHAGVAATTGRMRP